MKKISMLIVLFILLVTGSVFGQEVAPTEPVPAEPSKLEQFVMFWRTVAEKAEQQNREYKAEIDAQAAELLAKKNEVRGLLILAEQNLRLGGYSEFIEKMNKVEMKLLKLKREGVSVKKEMGMYHRLLKVATGQVEKVATTAKKWTRDSL